MTTATITEAALDDLSRRFSAAKSANSWEQLIAHAVRVNQKLSDCYDRMGRYHYSDGRYIDLSVKAEQLNRESLVIDRYMHSRVPHWMHSEYVEAVQAALDRPNWLS